MQKITENFSKDLVATFEYYKKNHTSERLIKSLKANIEDVPMEDEIKEFIVKNNVKTLEQLLVQNPIDWSNQPIKMIKKITEYFEKSGIFFENKSQEQKLIEDINLTKNEITVLEKNRIIKIDDLKKIEFEKLEKKLKKVPVLIRKLRRSKIELNVKKTTSIEALKIRYWTGQKIIRNGIKTIGELINNTPGEVQEKCNLTDGEMEEVLFRIKELGFDFEKKDKQLIK